MTIDEKVRKTLIELNVTDAAGVEALFAEVRRTLDSEQARVEDADEQTLKEFRDRWNARKS
jgi:hypothetical protein